MSSNVSSNEDNNTHKNACILMYKDIKVMSFNLNTLNNVSVINEVYDLKYVPFSVLSENITAEEVLTKSNSLNIWLYNRNVLSSGRETIKDLIDVSTMYDYLALNLSDHYWVQRVTDKRELLYKDINYFENDFSLEVGDALINNTKYEGTDLSSPDVNTNGALPKRWTIEKDKRILYKGSVTGHEPLNEIVANIVCHYSNIKYVPYVLINYTKPQDDSEYFLYSKCSSFIDIHTEYIPATYIRHHFRDESAGIEGYENMIKYYGQLLKQDTAEIRKELEDMLFLDYLIGNTDRHFHNFGLLRNADTLEFTGIAPLFDNGTALFHNHHYNLRDLYSDLYDALSEDDFKDICNEYNKTTYHESKPFFQYHVSQVQLIQNKERYKNINIGVILSSIKAVLVQHKTDEELNYVLNTIESRYYKLFS